jgi:hypothetical protein
MQTASNSNTAEAVRRTRKPTLAARMVTHGTAAGPLSMLDGIIYDRRSDGTYHKSRDQRKARERFRVLAGRAREAERVKADVARIGKPAPTVMTAERQTPTYRVAGDKKRLADFVGWYSRVKANGNA